MKTNIFELKVIKVKNNDSIHYFICKNKLFSNTYVEIFTGKKITVEDESYVEPLSNYFSTLEVCNYKTGKPLILNKKELLHKYIDINKYSNLNQNEENKFGDKNYQMSDKYKADNLVVANLKRISSKVTDFGPMVETTKQKYIFEIIVSDNKAKYRDIFTGFIAENEEEYFDLPYVVDPIPFTEYFPETKGIEIPKLSLIWAQNDINYSKNKELLKK